MSKFSSLFGTCFYDNLVGIHGRLAGIHVPLTGVHVRLVGLYIYFHSRQAYRVERPRFFCLAHALHLGRLAIALCSSSTR